MERGEYMFGKIEGGGKEGEGWAVKWATSYPNIEVTSSKARTISVSLISEDPGDANVECAPIYRNSMAPKQPLFSTCLSSSLWYLF